MGAKVNKSPPPKQSRLANKTEVVFRIRDDFPLSSSSTLHTPRLSLHTERAHVYARDERTDERTTERTTTEERSFYDTSQLRSMAHGDNIINITTKESRHWRGKRLRNSPLSITISAMIPNSGESCMNLGINNVLRDCKQKLAACSILSFHSILTFIIICQFI